MRPFFSIIIPLYNSSKTVLNALDSIAKQSFTGYELILIDGASADSTVELVERFRKDHQDIPIKLLSEPDKGIYYAMNKGIKLAGGEWLYFMGSDDKLASPTVLQVVYNSIITTPVDLVYGNVTGEASGKKYIYDTPSKVLSEGIHHQSVFYKLGIFSYTGDYDRRYKVAADYHLTLKIFTSNQFKIQYVDIDIATYGESGLSSTSWDYYFFSSHYKLLARKNALAGVNDPAECLDRSIHCCYQLAMQKKHLGSAWNNICYYVILAKGLSFQQRIKVLLRMIYWTCR